jgi:hypothetical protein
MTQLVDTRPEVTVDLAAEELKMAMTRLRPPDVWEFRWREAGADGIFADAETVIILFDVTATAKDGIPYRNPIRGTSK